MVCFNPHTHNQTHTHTHGNAYFYVLRFVFRVDMETLKWWEIKRQIKIHKKMKMDNVKDSRRKREWKEKRADWKQEREKESVGKH